jgi:hypothetical protein
LHTSGTPGDHPEAKNRFLIRRGTIRKQKIASGRARGFFRKRKIAPGTPGGAIRKQKVAPGCAGRSSGSKKSFPDTPRRPSGSKKSLPDTPVILGILDIYAGWGYWDYLWGYLGLPLITGIPGDMVYLCWLGLLGLPLGLPGATSDYRNSWGYSISMLAAATGATSGATWGYL